MWIEEDNHTHLNLTLPLYIYIETRVSGAKGHFSKHKKSPYLSSNSNSNNLYSIGIKTWYGLFMGTVV